MKKSLSFLSLMVAMAAGVAAAGGTTAGTTITNVATISYSDETGTPQTPIPSTPVTTKVSPVPDFTITPNQTTPGTKQTDPADFANPGQSKTAKPGDTVVFPYVLTNTGNVNGESYNLTTQNTPNLDPAGVKYYATNPDTNNDGVVSPAELAATTAPGSTNPPITSLSGVDKDKSVNFYQTYTIPTTAKDADKFGADPVGTRKPNGAPGSDNEPAAPFTQPTDSNNANLTTTQRTDAVLIGPKDNPKGDATGTTYPSTDPTPVTITKQGDTQTAPTTTTTTQVTFTNTVNNPGNRPDTFDIAGVPTNLPTGAVVTFIDPATGKPLTDTDGDGKPDTGPVAPGANKDIQVVITFPAGSTTTDNTKQPTVVVTATSANDPTKSDPTTDTVLLPGVLFGDKPKVGDPDPKPVVNQTVPAPTTPTGTTTTPLTSIPMGVKNTGGIAEPFTPATPADPANPKKGEPGTITFNTPDGEVTKPIKYLPDANCDGTPDSQTPIAKTPVINPGDTYCLIPVVDVPNNAYPGSYPLIQQVTGDKTGVKGNDTNDTVTIPKVPGKDYVTKTVDKASAKPGEDVKYGIIGKNNSNANFTNTIVSDKVPDNTTFKSLTATTTVTGGKVIYRLGGAGAWTATAPTAVPAGTLIEVGVDTNGDTAITAADIVKPGQELDVTFVVTVK
ncbi:DUF11 domain-containing protein [Deinococcus sp.]|uniref:DUF11 domain-containing protein n=1 Tax=Deinococcus sp. TaxID=47478 RepID=UPI003CC66C50